MNEIANAFGWIVGSGALIWVVLAIIAPSVLTAASSWLVALSPLVKGMADALVALGHRLWEGFLDVIDNVNTVIFVVLVALLTAWYLNDNAKCTDKCETCITELRKDYRFIERTPAEKRAYLKSKGIQDNSLQGYWERWFK